MCQPLWCKTLVNITMKYKRVIAFGCSFTSYSWPTWADMIGYDQDVPFYNQAKAGTGNVSIFHKMLEWDLKHKFNGDDLVLVCWSSWSREDRINGGPDSWSKIGNILNTPDTEFAKKYWCPQNDIVKNCTAIISANRMFPITHQTHMIEYKDPPWVEYFPIFSYLLKALPKKILFDNWDYKTGCFNGLIKGDTHPDINCHLNHAQQVYKDLGLELKQSTFTKYKDMHTYVCNHYKPTTKQKRQIAKPFNNLSAKIVGKLIGEYNERFLH